MKKEGSLKITLSILVIVLVTLVSMWGVYVKSGNTMKNKLPDYEYGMELKNTNIINLEVVKEETSEETIKEDVEDEVSVEENAEESEETNSEENNQASTEDIYTAKNYNKSKNIIEKRLKIVDVDQYTIRLDEKTGNMALELPTELSSSISQSIFTTGKFEIKITDNDEVIADNNSIKNVETGINSDYANISGYGSIVKLDFVFTKDAVNKFTEIQNTYELATTNGETSSVTSEDEEYLSDTEDEDVIDETTEETEIVDTDEIIDREVTLYLDGSSLYTTTMEDFLKYAVTGTLPLSMGGYTNDTETLESALQEANLTKSLVLTENLPIEYTSSTTTNIHSNINKKSIVIVFVVIFAVMCIYLIMKNKLAGLYGALSILGFISTLLLIVRFSNVALTFSSIFALAVAMIAQFIYILKLLKYKTINTKTFNEKTAEFIKMLIPVFLMSIVLSLAKIIDLIGIGNVVFWGFVVFGIFNNIITRAILTNGKNK